MKEDFVRGRRQEVARVRAVLDEGHERLSRGLEVQELAPELGGVAPTEPRGAHVKEELLDGGVFFRGGDTAEKIAKRQSLVAEERPAEIEEGVLRKCEGEIDFDRGAPSDGRPRARKAPYHEIERTGEKRQEGRGDEDEPEEPASSSVSGHARDQPPDAVLSSSSSSLRIMASPRSWDSGCSATMRS